MRWLHNTVTIVVFKPEEECTNKNLECTVEISMTDV